MGAFARAFGLTLLAYVIIAGVLIAKTGGPTAPQESAGPARADATGAAPPPTLANETEGPRSAAAPADALAPSGPSGPAPPGP